MAKWQTANDKWLNWQTGKLANWQTGKLSNWQTSKLATGKMVSGHWQLAKWQNSN
jgi:hypothetical protein